jgi:hypothetical protein
VASLGDSATPLIEKSLTYSARPGAEFTSAISTLVIAVGLSKVTVKVW